jgi:hypothetical protein
MNPPPRHAERGRVHGAGHSQPGAAVRQPGLGTDGAGMLATATHRGSSGGHPEGCKES